MLLARARLIRSLYGRRVVDSSRGAHEEDPFDWHVWHRQSSVISELAARGSIDADSDERSEWVPYVAIPDLPEANEPELEWVWRAIAASTSS